MNNLRKTIIGSIVVFALVGSAVLGLRWIGGGGLSENKTEITTVELTEKIRTDDVANVTLQNGRIELTTRQGATFFASVQSDAVKESVVKAVSDRNAKQTANKIALTEEEASPGFGWHVFVRFAPFVIFFGFWAVTIGVVIWAVKRLSGNKG